MSEGYQVDILLATYNGGVYLPDLLASLLAQTHRNWRLVVRDDGSDDGTREIIENWAISNGVDCQILPDDGKRLGACQSFAALLAASTAPYFMFCDQDDVWLPEKIWQTLRALTDREKHCGSNTPLMAHCDLKVVDEALGPVAPSFWLQSRLDPADAASHRRLIVENFTPGCAMMGNRALAENALPIPDDAIMHDWWLALVAAFTGQIVTMPDALILYRQHGKNAIGAQNWGAFSITRRFFQSPMQAVNRTRRILRLTARQAACFSKAYRDQISPADRATLDEYADLPFAGLLARKTYFWRSGLRPNHWLRTLVLWVFI